jgi:hypothetical protein
MKAAESPAIFRYAPPLGGLLRHLPREHAFGALASGILFLLCDSGVAALATGDGSYIG